MRNVLVFAAVVLFTSSAAAADRYAFHLRTTDGRTALSSNPDAAKLALKPEQLERAAQDRVIVLDAATGTHWRWLMLSWFASDPTIEQTVNDRGSGWREHADFALLAGTDGQFRVRCLRDDCRIAIEPDGGEKRSITLKRGEASPDLPFDARLEFTFAERE